MRRSKNTRFIVPFANNITSTEPPIKDVHLSSANKDFFPKKEHEHINDDSHAKRSLNDVLKLLGNESDEEDFLFEGKENSKSMSTNVITKPKSYSVSCTPSSSFQSDCDRVMNEECDEFEEFKTSETKELLTSSEICKMNNCGKDAQPPEYALYFSVMWCKRSGKKHKKWEGDGVLTVKSRTATLRDLDAKVIARGTGYKVKEVTSLEEGSKFFIGGKECEIQGIISDQDYVDGKCFQGPALAVDSENCLPNLPVGKKFQSPLTNAISEKFNKCQTSARSEIHDPDDFYLPRPSVQNLRPEQQSSVVEVKVDSHLAKHLREHQKQGVIFMYECIMGFKNSEGKGVILGDQMGLGKTLQCITLIWTLYKQGPYAGRPVLKKILIITPSSLVKNWQQEFYKWLGRDRIAVFAVGQDRKVKDFVNSNYSVLIISYEMYVRSAEALSSVKFDLVICDEGHRLKNLNIKTSGVISNLPTKKRILLTGTPIQNDLEEFYAIVEFVNPGVLGPIVAFRRIYVEPIKLSQNPNCNEDEKILGNARAVQLAELVGMFFLRRTQEVINKYLPPKYEFVVFCRPTELQCNLYDHLMQSRAVYSVLNSYGISCDVSPLQCINILRKICNHPSLLYDPPQNCDEDQEMSDNSMFEYMQNVFPKDYAHHTSHSGKLKVLSMMLRVMYDSKKKEKIVIVSNFTQTLNILEELCQNCNYNFLRLDGSTNSSLRQKIVDQFNSPFSTEFIFLLSSKAGGVGLNLIGASRIVLYDIDWNPANDLQAMSRIWRDGQRKQVYIYRLITTGSIEEKIFQRQITKQGLSGAIIDTTNTASKSQFSVDELKDLFTFKKNDLCLTHNSIQCNCLEQVFSIEQDISSTSHNLDWLKHSNQEKNTNMAELFKWKHIAGPISKDLIPIESHLANCEDITFLFMNKVNFGARV